MRSSGFGSLKCCGCVLGPSQCLAASIHLLCIQSNVLFVLSNSAINIVVVLWFQEEADGSLLRVS